MLYGTWRLYSGKGSFKFMKLQLNDDQNFFIIKNLVSLLQIHTGILNNK